MTKRTTNFIKNFFSSFIFHASRYRAFTLAEVLITLGIIGVVASLTIPVLMDKFEKQATIEGYKKAYSTLQNAVRMSETENGTIDSWDFPTTISDNNQSIQFANTYLLPYLSISKKCELSYNCFVRPNRPDGISTGILSPVQYILNDGTAIELINLGYSFLPTNAGRLSIYVDINGMRKPNTVGKDAFVFVLVQKSADRYNAGSGDITGNVKAGGIYPDGYGLDITSPTKYQYRGCGKDVDYGYAGAYCGMKIIQDGYQIKDDYPW